MNLTVRLSTRLLLLAVITAAGGCASSGAANGQVASRSACGSRSGTVSGEQIMESRGLSLEEILAARITGVKAVPHGGGNYSLQIRGTHSMSAPGEPLYVLNGTPMGGGATGLSSVVDIRDIACVEVLRDAGSLSFYGSRGSNGVVLVTTRKQ